MYKICIMKTHFKNGTAKLERCASEPQATTFLRRQFLSEFDGRVLETQMLKSIKYFYFIY